MRKHNTDLYTTDATPLRAFLQSQGMKPAELADLIGASRTTPAGWISSDRMPRYMLLVLAHLQSNGVRLIISPGDKIEAVRSVLSAMAIPFTEI